MRPLFKIALTMFIGASIVIAYKMYSKKSRKRSAQRINRTSAKQAQSDETMSPSSEISQNTLHISGSEKVRLDNKLGKLRGRKSDSEIREIEQQNVDFQSCQLIAASKNKKENSEMSSTSKSTTTSGLTISSISNSSMASSAPASGSSSFQIPSDSSVRIPETFNVVDPDSNKTEPSIITTSTNSTLSSAKSE